jgi:hypothetical protein
MWALPLADNIPQLRERNGSRIRPTLEPSLRLLLIGICEADKLVFTPCSAHEG